ncbi:MAG: hypothetical protein HGA79_08925 [Anaerolineales bacterium]|nr:hypothetical protein [Anaerolineales bacterium]
MNAQPVEYKIKILKACGLTLLLLLTLALTACTPSAAPTPQVSPPQPNGQADATSHPPVILRVEEREEIQNGWLILIKDIYFTDPEGDATTIVNTLVATDPAELSLPIGNDSITTPAEEQKREGLAASPLRCSSTLIPYSLTIEDRIRDAAGNLSEPVTVTFACPTNPPNSLPFVIAAFIIGLGLLAGLWLSLRKHPSERTPSILSVLLLVCTLFPMYFLGAILHEGGHALANLLIHGMNKTLYIHPFTFAGFARPFTDNAWFHAAGYITSLLVSSVIFALLWKRRSIANLSFVMTFPFWAFGQGLLILLLNGDTANILRLTGLPAILFIVLGFAMLCLGLLFLLALFPLLGLAPTNKKSLLIVPTAFFFHSALSMLIAHTLVPGSSIDRQYLLGAETLNSANTMVIVMPILGALFAALYLTLFHKIKLPAWVQTETVNITWNDLRLPAMLTVISLALGLIIITL